MKQKRKLTMRFRHHFVILTLLLSIIATIGIFTPGESIAQDDDSVSLIPSNLAPISAWNVNDIEQLTVMGRGTPLHAEWSPDGQWFAVQTSIGVWLYPEDDLESPPRQLAGDHTPILTFTFHPDSHQIATAHPDGEIVVWDIEGGGIEFVIESTQYGIEQIAISPNGSGLAIGGQCPRWIDGSTRCAVLWNLHSNRVVTTVVMNEMCCFDLGGLGFSPDSSKFIAAFYSVGDGGYGGQFEIRDTLTGELLYEDDEATYTIKISRVGNFLLGLHPFNYVAGIFNLDSFEWQTFDLNGWISDVMLADIPDHFYAVFRENYYANTTQIIRFSIPDENFATVLTLPSKLYLAIPHPDADWQTFADVTGTLYHWNMATDEMKSIEHFYGTIDQLSLTEDYGIFTTASQAVSAWHTNTGDFENLTRIQDIAAMDVSPNGTWLAIGDNYGSIYLGSPEQSTAFHVFRAHYRHLTALKFRSDSTYFVSSGDPTEINDGPDVTILWEINSFTSIEPVFEYQLGGASAIAFASDNSSIAIGDLLIDSDDNSYQPPTDGFCNSEIEANVAYSPDGRYIVTGGEIPALGGSFGSALCIFDSELLEVTMLGDYYPWYAGPFNRLPINDLAISTDGSLIAVTDDLRVRIYSLQQKRLLRVLPISSTQLEFSQDGHLLVIASEGTVQLWGIPAS